MFCLCQLLQEVWIEEILFTAHSLQECYNKPGSSINNVNGQNSDKEVMM